MRAAFGAADGGGAFVSLSSDGRVLATVSGASTDDLLGLLERALAESGSAAASISEIAVDQGPDGFSTVRRRVAVTTALSRSLGTTLACASGLSPETAAALPSSDFTSGASVTPIYAASPHITVSKKKKTWTTR